MSLYKGTELLAGISTDTISNGHSLFDFKPSDHILNEMSWLRADTFSWHNGDLYKAAYEHLSTEYTNVASNPLTETIGEYTITYYRAEDGHKIVLANQEDTVDNIYNASGVAWYYIIDITNKRFKLPRTKYGFTGLRDTVGNYIKAGLPNITGTFDLMLNGTLVESGIRSSLTATNTTGAFSTTKTTNVDWHLTTDKISTNENGHYTPNFNASRSSSIYGNSNTVQPPATQVYLYFYVGEYSQSAIIQTAGVTTEVLNNKLDKDDLEECEVVVETYRNGSSWYRLYSDGWIEQGGLISITDSSKYATVNLYKEMLDNTYYVNVMMPWSQEATGQNEGVTTVTTTSFRATASYIPLNGCMWEVKGWIK